MVSQCQSDIASDWRKIPQKQRPLTADNVSPDVRASRDRFFDKVIGTLPSGAGSAWDKMPFSEEIPAYKGITIAVVEFEDYTVIQSASQRSVYTEVRMSVEQVLKDQSAAARAGQDLTVILGGGSLRLPSGRIITRDLDLGDFGIQPRHRYLAFIAYEKTGTYFVG
jgi:hypothetical protein